MEGQSSDVKEALTANHPYGESYFRSYPTGRGRVPYDRTDPEWQAFFSAVAERIVREIAPRTVLDVGCAKGMLVEALRDRGVEAYGLDISEYAISQVRLDVRPYCRVASAAQPIEGRYDLITCIEVLEHLSEGEGRRAIANICASTSDVLFSSTPDQGDDPTHVNVRPLLYWVERFAEHGFVLDVDFDAGFIAPHALRFRRAEETEVLAERLLRQRMGVLEQLRQLSAESVRLVELEKTLGWRMLQGLRRVRDRVAPFGTWRRDAYWTAKRAVEVLLDEGMLAVLRRSAVRVRQRLTGGRMLVVAPEGGDSDLRRERQYPHWLKKEQRSGRGQKGKAGADAFIYRPLISILAPVYNVETRWLRAAIESVRGQTYSNWELCLVNDGSTRAGVRELLEEYALGDRRVRVRHLGENRGIVGASNVALEMATGEFVGLLDHDDELAPEALFEVVARLNVMPELDLIYTDEDKLELDGRRVEPFFKPDWSPDLLLSMNYIAHFCVIRRSVVLESGGFREGFDGSQDYDLLLRITERTTRIGHVPRILYHWRKVPGSAAGSSQAKAWACGAARRAVAEAVRRRGREAAVEMRLPGVYRVRYRIEGAPMVSIVIPTRDRARLLRDCVMSIERTEYARYEIVLVDNGSAEAEAKRLLDELGRRWVVVRHPGPFNFSALCNRGAAAAKGEYLVFLNNDTRVKDGAWLGAMLEHAQRPEVGAVGAKLIYPDGTIQHAGIVLLCGAACLAGHAFRYHRAERPHYFGLTEAVRNCTAVTAACMMVRRAVFEEIGGFDPQLPVAFNDVDLCLRLRERGYLIVYTPHAVLYHLEGGSRGRWHPQDDERRFRERWATVLARGDPYYNPNLTVEGEDWSLRL